MEYQDKKSRRERNRGKPRHKDYRDSFDANCRRMQKQRIRREKYGY
jgi:hypothetical protein